MRVVKNNALLPTPFLSVSVNTESERGLLGIAFDPDFASNQYVYIYYTTSAAPIHNRVSRFTANGDVAVAGSELPNPRTTHARCGQPQRRCDPLRTG
ncbi:MAG: PQQ-dependent sugar dehydrogenase [Paludibaculum sp.]